MNGKEGDKELLTRESLTEVCRYILCHLISSAVLDDTHGGVSSHETNSGTSHKRPRLVSGCLGGRLREVSLYK